MSNTKKPAASDLETRLRELLANAFPGEDDSEELLDLVRVAARIGADLEREACADLAHSVRKANLKAGPSPYADCAADLRDAIRARGGK